MGIKDIVETRLFEGTLRKSKSGFSDMELELNAKEIQKLLSSVMSSNSIYSVRSDKGRFLDSIDKVLTAVDRGEALDITRGSKSVAALLGGRGNKFLVIFDLDKNGKEFQKFIRTQGLT